MKGRIYKRSGRGFHSYGKPMRDTYGGELEVYESSAATGPRVWLRIQEGAAMKLPTEACAHLNEKQARALIARLQTWIDEIPKRWGR